MQKERSAGKWLLFSFGIQNASQLLILVVLSRLITPGDFGIYSINVLLISLMSILIQWGLTEAIIQKKYITKKYLYKKTLYLIAWHIFLMSSFYLTKGSISKFLEIEVNNNFYAFVLCSVLCNSIYLFFASFFQKNMNFKIVSVIELVSYLISYVFIGISLAIFGLDLYALLISNLSFYLLRIFFLMFFEPVQQIKMNLSDEIIITEKNFLSTKFLINRVFSYVYINLDNWLIVKFLSSDVLGYYSRVYQLISLPAKLFSVLTDKLFFTTLSARQEDKEYLWSKYLNINMFLVSTVIPLSIIVFLYAENIIYLFLGKQWIEAIAPLEILSFSIFFRTAYKIGETILNSRAALMNRLLTQIQTILIMFFLITMFIKFGIEGVALAVTISICLMYFLIDYQVKKELGQKFISFSNFYKERKSYSKTVLLICVILIIHYWLETAFLINSILYFLYLLLYLKERRRIND